MSRRKESGIPGISREVEYVWSLGKFFRLWPELDRVMDPIESRSFVKKVWDDYRLLYEPEVSESRYFLIRAQKELNSRLNEILGRPADHPTLNNLLAYALRNEIGYSQACNDMRMDRALQHPDFKFYKRSPVNDRFKKESQDLTRDFL